MPIILSHLSALEFWRSARSKTKHYSEVKKVKKMLSDLPKYSPIEIHGAWWLNSPLHVLVSSGGKRRNSTTLICHVVSSTLPRSSILDAEGSFAVCSPELCFIQMAETLGVPELVKLGFEFCGTYDASSADIIQSCQPLTSVTQLKAYISKIRDVRGVKKARQAIPHIIDNSASPMETALAMLLCLPYRYGGFGLPKPHLNYRIDLDADKRRRKERGYYVGDLCWPESHFIFEYDSDMHHTEQVDISKDAKKRSDLAQLGVTVMSVTRAQIFSDQKTEKLAWLLADRIGRQIRYNESAFAKAHFELRKILFAEMYAKAGLGEYRSAFRRPF